MRLVITTGSDALYRRVAGFLTERYCDNIRVASPKRRMVSVEDLPSEAVNTIRATGASVTEELQYNLEAQDISTTVIG